MDKRPHTPRRAVLYVPASNEKALAKVAGLACDAVVLDLEDSVAPERKAEARARVGQFLREVERGGREWVVRINALETADGDEDLAAVATADPDAILLPKVSGTADLDAAARALGQCDAPPQLALWAMIETAMALLDLPTFARHAREPGSRLACLVAGHNDIVKETGIRPGPGRVNLLPLMTQMVLAAKAGGMAVLDSVSNDFRDLDAFAAECRQAAELGFDGKTLIHPAQIEPALSAFSPSAGEVAEAEAIVAAFRLPENAGKGAIALHGRMVERLHLDQAQKLLAKAERR